MHSDSHNPAVTTHPVHEQESTLEAGREREEALQQLEQERAQLQAVAQSQQRMAQQLDSLGQELAATRQQLQQSQASLCCLLLWPSIPELVLVVFSTLLCLCACCKMPHVLTHLLCPA